MENQRVIIVTGGGSGIGKAIATEFAHNGDTVIILGRTEAKLQAVCDELGSNASYQIVDVSQHDQVERAIASIMEVHNQIDVLINNAGFVHGLRVDTPLAHAESIWDDVVGANLKGAMLMAVAVCPHLTRPTGRIINIGSIAAYTGGSRGGVIAYGSAKAGIHGLTVALARELSPEGITVNTISPGLIGDTDFFGGALSPERIQMAKEQIPIGRPGKPEEIAGTVYFLASEQASYITGEVLHLNGGWLFGH